MTHELKTVRCSLLPRRKAAVFLRRKEIDNEHHGALARAEQAFSKLKSFILEILRVIQKWGTPVN